ncbi:hypothetical protein FQN53_002875 [Emmonsiellopsis sp. PD_33]|nr:hypothetical protein FQN53_002875 [Emmonsiellopsis sp. PD_33]
MAAQTETPEYHLLGSYTRFSSWTARVDTLLEYYRIPHSKKIVKLGSDVKAHSNTGLVPVLIASSLPPNTQVSDSFAICEYLAEAHPDLPLWPKDRYLRALARSAAAQMHSGFTGIRNRYYTNFVGKYTGNIPLPDEARRDLEKILAIWDEARKRTVERLGELGQLDEDEGFLFGKFGIADSYYWPVLWRIRTYNLPLTTATPEALAWMKTMWSDPRIKAMISDYFRQVEDPESAVPKYENVFKDSHPDVKYGSFTEDWEFSYPK